MLFLVLGIVGGILIPIIVYTIFAEKWDKLKKRTKTRIHLICILVFIACIGGGAFGSSMVIVPAGNVGVQDLFGDVNPDELNAGFNFKHPLANVEMMSIKTNKIKERSEVPSKEGLIVRLDVSILFKIMPYDADEIYKTVGTRYWNVVIIPQLRSVIREVTASYEAKALYTTGRINITRDIFKNLYPNLLERGIILEKVLLRDLGIPQKLLDAIELKLTAEQQIEQKEFEVVVAEKEADRKRAEAKGIADAMNIIDRELTPEYLQHEAIMMSEQLVNSENTVFYFVPMSSNGMGMPLTFNQPLGPVK